MLTHTEHAKRAGVATPCTAHHVNYGGGCLNCGWSPYPHPSHVTPTTRFHVTGLQPDTQEPRP